MLIHDCLVRRTWLSCQSSGWLSRRHVLGLDLIEILKLMSRAVFESDATWRVSRDLVVVDLMDETLDTEATPLVEEVNVASVV